MARADLIRARFDLLLPLAAIVPAVVFALIWKFANQDIRYIGEGLDGSGSCFCAGAACWYAIIRRFSSDEASQKTPSIEIIFRSIATHFAVAPFSIIAGRIVFSVFSPWLSEYGSLFGLVIGSSLVRLVRATPSSRFIPQRGTVVLRADEVERRRLLLAKTSEPEIVWAGKKYPSEIAFGNIVVAGGVGAGKTLMCRQLLASVVPHIVPGSDRRAIIYDVKSDLIAELQTMDVKCEILILNPFDKRCVAWDIANDVSTPTRARQFAHALIPLGVDEEDRFFASAARGVITGVINSLNRKNLAWTLRDLINLAADKELMESLLGKSSRLVKQFFSPEKTFKNVVNEMGTVLSALEPVAALWAQTTEKRSLRDWIDRGDSILILGGNEDNREALQVINRVMLKIMAASVFARDESPQKSTLWFFCDELADAGKLDCLPALLNARSKGVRCVLGFQDFEGLFVGYRNHDAAKAVIGKCDTISWLRLTTDETADWACKRSGRVERLEYFENRGKDGTSFGEQLNERDAILASEFMGLPVPRNGKVEGFHMIRGLGGVAKEVIQFDWKKFDKKQNLVPRPNGTSQELEEWTDEDALRIGVAQPAVQDPVPLAIPVQTPSADLDQIQRVEFT